MVHLSKRSRTSAPWFSPNTLLAGLLILLTLPSSTQAMATYRTVRITSIPPGATITTNGVVAGRTPLTLPEFQFKETSTLTVAASLVGYETKIITKNQVDADAIPRRERDYPGMPIVFELQPLQLKLPVRLDAGNGAKFFVNGVPAEADTILPFKREKSTSPWQSIVIRAEQKDYQPAEKIITKESFDTLPLTGDKKKVQFNLTEVRHTVALNVTVNIEGAQITMNGTNICPVGPDAPTPVTLVFERLDGQTPWSVNVLEVAKDGYEFSPPAPAEAQPVFSTNLTLELAESLRGKLAVMYFQQLRQLPSPWRRVVVDRGEVRLDVTNVMSAITPGGMVNQFNPNFVDENGYFIAGRYGMVPASQDAQGNGKPLSAVVAVAKRVIRDGVPAEVIGSELLKVYAPPAKKVEKLTSMGTAHGTYDLQPCVSSDGKYIYFSSNRSDDGQYHIFRIRANASSYLEEITHPQPGIDLEPTVFTDHDGKDHLAFTRYPTKSAIRAEPHIMVQTSEGGFAQVGDPGHSPAWSHDGTRIAYVSTKGKICIMNPEDGSRVELESGTAPAWLPGDKQIVFAKPNGNSFGLAIIDIDGSNGVNPIPDSTSFYSYPTVSFDEQKTYIYFISNRQIQQRGDPRCWGLYYIDWKR